MTKPESLDDVMRQVLAVRGMAAASETSAGPHRQSGDVFAEAVAAPEGAESYNIMVPPGLQRDGALEAKARQWFHRAGLPQNAVSGIIQEYCRQLCEADPSMPRDGGAQNAQAILAQEWGPDYQSKVAAAQALIAKSGGAEELAHILDTTGFGDNPWLIRTLAALGELDPHVGGDK